MAFIKSVKTVIFLLLATGLLFSQQVLSESISPSAAAKLYDTQTTYSIYRKGKNIGQHKLSITAISNRVEVAVDSRITVRILKIPVFKFSYLSKEHWEDDQLVKVSSTTTTNKEAETATLQNKNGKSEITYNNAPSTTALLQYPTNHWNMGAVEQSSVFNTVKGVKSDVNVKVVGKERLRIGGKQLDTTHYAYSGDIIAETWYDKNQRWVKLAFLGSDGNQITYLIDNP